jgi:uncharacterized protein YijF (DUF1287 family)
MNREERNYMAHLQVTIPENSQNILGTVTIDAPLEKVFEAYNQEKLFASRDCQIQHRSIEILDTKCQRTQWINACYK